ncbi:MAG TPA: hypothetical protein PLY34_21330 [Ferruginibacter sp.]|nr:hypothetical protein [Ferruginibacter sp.]HPH93204.1 hypothetical protein [Ferruginibacter sp.]
MRFFSRLFSRNKVDCPRCLGKGDVDPEDIKRLRKELYWVPGKCAYCNGAGKVSSKRVSTIHPGTEYLTTDLAKGEREKLLHGDKGALQRAKEHQAEIEKILQLIEHLYYIENQEAEQIADYLLGEYKILENSPGERQEIMDYVETVIASKLTGK